MIFGWGHQKQKYLGEVFQHQCEHCNNNVEWVLHKSSVWFTLFFVPVVPYQNENLVSCPVCSYGYKIEDYKLDIYESLVKLYKDFKNGVIKEDDYSKIVDEKAKELNS